MILIFSYYVPYVRFVICFTGNIFPPCSCVIDIICVGNSWPSVTCVIHQNSENPVAISCLPVPCAVETTRPLATYAICASSGAIRWSSARRVICASYIAIRPPPVPPTISVMFGIGTTYPSVPQTYSFTTFRHSYPRSSSVIHVCSVVTSCHPVPGFIRVSSAGKFWYLLLGFLSLVSGISSIVILKLWPYYSFNRLTFFTWNLGK
jgi:hypothetical protein